MASWLHLRSGWGRWLEDSESRRHDGQRGVSGTNALSHRLSGLELNVAFFVAVFYEKRRSGEKLIRFTHPQPVIICLRKKFDLPF